MDPPPLSFMVATASGYVLSARSGVPLTPVAEHLSVFLQRAAVPVHWPASRARSKA